MTTKSQVKILIVLFQNECKNPIKAYTIDKIVDATELSLSTVRKSLKILRSEELVEEGILHHKAKSYYISKLGKTRMKELSK